jgi:exopolysaccharide biosynthesis protein
MLRRPRPARSLCFGAIIAAVLTASAAGAATSVAYQKTKVGGVWMNLVTVNLNDPNVSITPAVSRWGIGSCESFRSMMRRTRPAAAIDGTFFCTRTLRPTGDIVIDRKLIWKGYLGMVLAINSNRFVSFLPSRRQDLYSWSAFDDVLAAGPSLVRDGKIAVVPRAEGFRSGVHFSRRIRAAVGLTRANKLLLATTTRPYYLGEVARAMKSLKCVDAAGLDGGSSTGLYWKGKLIRNPSRGMTNCLLVYDNPDAFEQRRSAFCPGWKGYESRSTDSGQGKRGEITFQL